MSNKKVIVITGPTGSGKTDISLKIAEIINGEIINSDASQFKKDLNIGTAKLDLTKTNIKHHLIDFLDADKNYSIKDFQENGRKIIDDIISRGKTPMVVGGTGLYINALLYDYNLTDDERDPNFEIKYQDAYGNLSVRKIAIRKVVGKSLKAHCFLRNEERTFIISRIVECIDLNTGELISGDLHSYFSDRLKK